MQPRPVLAIATAALLLLVGTQANANNLVLNGNFDADNPPVNTAPSGWTLTPAASDSAFVVSGTYGFGALSAPNAANFGAVGSTDDVLSQTLSTTPGATYTLSYYLANAGGSPNDFSASWGGTTIPGSVLVDASAFPFTPYSFTLTATSTSTLLAFAGRQKPSWYDLDNVSVSAVPEPASLSMLGVGAVVLMGYASRRRKAL